MTHVKARCAKPFGAALDAAKVDGSHTLCTRLLHASMLLNIATIVYTAAIILYGARLRTEMRERFGIEGA